MVGTSPQVTSRVVWVVCFKVVPVAENAQNAEVALSCYLLLHLVDCSQLLIVYFSWKHQSQVPFLELLQAPPPQHDVECFERKKRKV